MFKTPILIIAWRRPEQLKRVINSLKIIKPKYLYVAIDGRRQGAEYDDEAQLIEESKKIVETAISWECELSTNFQEKNLGCGQHVSSAINWFFNHIDAGIILEDDIIADKTFFSFCEQMLNKYEKDKNIFQITGSNWLPIKIEEDYFFSNITTVWGWATWKNRWEQYSLLFSNKKEDWEKVREKLFSIFKNISRVNFHMQKFYDTRDHILDTWDYQMRFLVLLKNYHVIVPSRNLISNIGFDNFATHTKNSTNKRNNLNRYRMPKNLNHPHKVLNNDNFDRDLDLFVWDHKPVKRTKIKDFISLFFRV